MSKLTEENKPRRNDFDGSWSWRTLTDRQGKCGRGAKLLQTPTGSVIRTALTCGSWNCPSCAPGKREGKLRGERAADLIPTHVCRTLSLADHRFRGRLLSRIRKQDGGSIFIIRDDTDYYLFANCDFGQGEKPTRCLPLGDTAREQILTYALRLPGVLKLHFGGTWKLREPDTRCKLLGVGYWLTRPIVEEILAAAGGLLHAGEWTPKPGLSNEEFRKAVVREYQRGNRVRRKS